MSQYGAADPTSGYGAPPSQPAYGAYAQQGGQGAYGQEPQQGQPIGYGQQQPGQGSQYGQEEPQSQQALGINGQEEPAAGARPRIGLAGAGAPEESPEPARAPSNELARPGAAGRAPQKAGPPTNIAAPVRNGGPNHAHSRFSQDPHHHIIMQHYHKVASHGMTASHIESFVHLGTLGLSMLAKNAGMTAGHEPEEEEQK